VRRCELVNMEAFHFALARSQLLRVFVRSQIGPTPYRVAKFANPRMRALTDQWANECRYGVVHCDHLSTWQYGCRVPQARRILLDHNVESQIFETLARSRRPPASWLLRREARRTATYESSAANAADHTLLLSADDHARLASRLDPGARDRLSVWPVPVRDAEPLPMPSTRRLLVLGALTSAGRSDGLRWLLREVWPAVRRSVPDAGLDVVGAHPPADIRAHDGRNGVSVHGYVDDLEPVLRESKGCLIPLFVGGGLRVKVLELIARGLPCAGTPLAVQGAAELPGVLSLGTAAEWINAGVDLLRDNGQIREQALEGRRVLLAEHRPENAIEHLASVRGA
jgi:polysaccharide biosynthesis protein PslH